nr:cobalt-precorrin-5B (C(1))-methyltransferase CbiD [Dissulfurirhabdus thermomarina]
MREGFTTGASAAAAAVAAALAALDRRAGAGEVEIPFPDGRRRALPVAHAERTGPASGRASVVKDAGDDPDVTHGAEIVAEVVLRPWDGDGDRVAILGGPGVGRVTKPGLAVPPGEPAINPVPRRMIRRALEEVLPGDAGAAVTVSIPGGERLAGRTLNRRLGIVGGLSILGTTGIVKPISAEAWCATIRVAMDVALAAGLDGVVLATGRTSERAARHRLGWPEEAYVGMGDYLGYAVAEAARRPFRRVVLAAQWAKMMKCAMGWEQTHVRHGALAAGAALEFLRGLAPGAGTALPRRANTAREVFHALEGRPEGPEIFAAVTAAAARRLRPRFRPDQAFGCLLVSYAGGVAAAEGC